jgi:hypothetical protein
MTPREALHLIIETDQWKVDYWGRNPRLMTITALGTREFIESIQKALKGGMRYSPSESRRPPYDYNYAWIPADDDREEIAKLMIDIMKEFDPFRKIMYAKKLLHEIREERLWSRLSTPANSRQKI